MIGQFFNAGSMLQGLGAVTQSPLAKTAMRYWWLTLPVGYLTYKAYSKRKAQGKVDPADLVMDIAPALTLAIGLVMLDTTLRHTAATSTVPAAAPAFTTPTPPVEAEFVNIPTPGASNG